MYSIIIEPIIRPHSIIPRKTDIGEVSVISVVPPVKRVIVTEVICNRVNIIRANFAIAKKHHLSPP